MRDKMIFPVDWESAAIAAGEIDLASMTEGWPSDIVTRCREAYQRARWGNGVPEGSQIRLKAAEMYLQFRWLGDNAAWTHAESWRFGVLRKLVGDFRTYLE
jgi:thiamine kinase-like enzyme